MDCTTQTAKSQPATLAALAQMDREFLIPKEVAPILGVSPYAISLMAKSPTERVLLGFPVVRVGTRTKIPRIPFLHFMGWKGTIKGEESEA